MSAGDASISQLVGEHPELPAQAPYYARPGRWAPPAPRYADELAEFLAHKPAAVSPTVDEEHCALCGQPGAAVRASSGVRLHGAYAPDGSLVRVSPWREVGCWVAWASYGYRELPESQ